MRSLQHQFWPDSICFGCGPANSNGLQLTSFVEGEHVIATWQPKPEHQAFTGILNGGIIGTLLDCHCNIAAGWFYYGQQHQLDRPPITLTAEYSIQLLSPTDPNHLVALAANLVKIEGRKIWVCGQLSSKQTVTARCQGLFIARDEA